MVRKDVETVSLSFLDLLSCALGGVILLMLIFTAVMYGKYSHRKSLVLYANVGNVDDVDVFAVKPSGDEIPLLSEKGSGLLYMIQERPEFGDWQLIAKRTKPDSSTQTESTRFEAVTTVLSAEVDSAVFVTNWMPFDDALTQARKSAIALSSARRKKFLDANTLKELQSGVFSICSSVNNRGRTIDENNLKRKRVSLACESILKDLAGTDSDKIEELVGGVFFTAFGVSGVTAEGRPDHRDRFPPVRRSVHLLAVLCALHSGLNNEQGTAKTAAAVSIKSIIGEYLYLCRGCDLLPVGTTETKESGLTHESVLAYQVILFRNRVPSSRTVDLVRLCLSASVQPDLTKSSNVAQFDVRYRNAAGLPSVLKQRYEEMKDVPYSRWFAATLCDLLAEDIVQDGGLASAQGLRLLNPIVERDSQLDLSKTLVSTKATPSLVLLAAMNGPEVRRLPLSERVSLAESLSENVRSDGLRYLRDQQPLLLQQAGAEALLALRELATAPFVVEPVNLHWGGIWETRPKISVKLSDTQHGKPILAFSVTQDDLLIERDGDGA
ncbi:hypothetical protein [Rhodopirellula sallentina]|uniref:Uncharacterized protein n=1 Tax=Rhodopirellula sallentina SM41 TaxID=1263870 RepID=M5UH20_9BACT|nr:hypothetical protein [Rhodopirellula sallentina]EMI55318.1 hypothetical protein RSSM_03224 [Rhodopirellula sallentina SM41]